MSNVQEMIADVAQQIQDADIGATETPKEEVQETTETVTEEVKADEAEDQSEAVEEATESTQEEKKESRAEKRIRELNERMKAAESQSLEYKAQLDAYKPLIEQSLNKQEEVVHPEFEEFDTQEQLVEYAKQQAMKEMMEKIAPQINSLTQESDNTKYVNNINNWFAQNPDAKGTEQAMTAMVESFSPEEKQLYQKQILHGNTRILNMLYASVSPNALNKKADKQNEAVKQAIQEDQLQATTAKASSSTRGISSTTKSNKEAIADAYKTGRWGDLINEMGIR